MTKYAIGLAALLVACGGSKDQARSTADSTQAADTAVTAPAAAFASGTPATTPTCPPTGRWALCSVEKRLGQAGFVVKRSDSVASRRAGFSITPVAYTLGRGKLEVFVYPDAKSLARDWSELDTLSASPRGKLTAWGVPPTLVRSANLAAVYLTDSPVQAERLALALTAGPPQPGSTEPVKRQVLPTVEVRPRN
jgi:hypothetical protein